MLGFAQADPQKTTPFCRSTRITDLAARCARATSTTGGNMNSTSTTGASDRTVLCVASTPDEALAAFLGAAGWQVVHARTTAAAEKLLDRGDIKVGLVTLPDDVTQQQLSALEACMRHGEANWIAQIAPGHATDDLTSRFILDYCFDFVTAPCMNDRLIFALGHAHGLSNLRRASFRP